MPKPARVAQHGAAGARRDGRGELDAQGGSQRPAIAAPQATGDAREAGARAGLPPPKVKPAGDPTD